MKLSAFLESSKYARKIFGKKELDIIGKQLEGRNLTQSEKNRLSRDIRPKFEFIKDAGRFEEEFKLKKNQDNKNLIERVVGTMLKDALGSEIKAILLFGSFADGTAHRGSDIDVCAVFEKELSLKEATKFRIRISGNFSKKADIQVFNLLPSKVKRSIARNHKVLYKKEGYDNLNFSIRYLKDNDYFMRMSRIFGAGA